MRTYYRDRQIEITSFAVSVDGIRYPLCDLERAWRTNGHVAGRRVMTGIGVLMAAIVGSVALRYTSWWGGLRERYPDWLSGGAGTTVLVGFAALMLALVGVMAVEVALLAIEHVRDHGRHQELWVVVHGQQVLLLRTTDAIRFGQVRRALARALADQPYPS
jgi:hypothetical protein